MKTYVNGGEIIQNFFVDVHFPRFGNLHFNFFLPSKVPG